MSLINMDFFWIQLQINDKGSENDGILSPPPTIFLI